MRKLAILFCVLTLLCGCGKSNNPDKTMTVQEQLESVIEEDNYIVVDVRTKEEYENAHVKGAINIPYDTIDENTDLDKAKTIIVYCQSGGRSAKAKETLKNLGFEVLDLGAFDTIYLEKE